MPLPAFVPRRLSTCSRSSACSPAEVKSRYEVKLEKYNKLINIEASRTRLTSSATVSPPSTTPSRRSTPCIRRPRPLDGQEQANVYAHEVVPAMDTLRAAVDAMEEIVAADYWPVPTYDDILFYV